MKMISNTCVSEIQKCQKWGDIEVLLYSTSYKYAGLHSLEKCDQFEILYIFQNTIRSLDNHNFTKIQYYNRIPIIYIDSYLNKLKLIPNCQSAH